MAIMLNETKGALKAFRRTASQLKHQRTFQRPSANLRAFVAAISVALEPVREACVVLDEITFKPENLNSLLARHSISTHPMTNTRYLADWSIHSSDGSEAQELLMAVLSDWIDFAFIPAPKRFVIYADEDEYVTFFAATKSHLNSVTALLEKSGFHGNDYERRF